MAEDMTETARARSASPEALERRAAMQSWKIGDCTVTKIVEMVMTAPAEHTFTGATSAQMLEIEWLKPDHITDTGDIIMSMHALVVDTPTKRIMVDTCVGNDKERAMEVMANLQTTFLKDLEGAGFARESFDVVLCTHLHVDHVGWNTMLVDGQWVPTFPNARYLLERDEFEYWRKGEDLFTANSWDVIQNQTFADSVQPVVDAGLVDLVNGDHKVSDEVDLVPSRGHSPGHYCVRIRSQGQEALITGDATHHPSQLRHLHWGMALDYDGAAATETRRRMFTDAADREVLVIGTHWAGNGTASKIEREGEAFRLKRT